MLEAILNNKYDASILNAPAVAILWAAEWIADLGKAKMELAMANSMREKHGLMPAYPSKGSRLF